MIDITINPYFFVLPAFCLVAAIVARNKMAAQITVLSLSAAIALTFMASNPVLVSDGVTKIWHKCRAEMNAGAKTCHVQFGPK